MSAGDILYQTLVAEMEPQPVPKILLVEFGHHALPLAYNELVWAEANILMAEELCRRVIQHFGRRVRIVPLMIINDLGVGREAAGLPEAIKDRLTDTRLLRQERVRLVSERNLRNRAVRRLSAITMEGSVSTAETRLMFTAQAGLDCPLPIGNLNEGYIVPRCGPILATFVEMAVTVGQQRLWSVADPPVTLLSFAANRREHQQTLLGTHLYLDYWAARLPAWFTSIIATWSPESDPVLDIVRHRPHTLVSNL